MSTTRDVCVGNKGPVRMGATGLGAWGLGAARWLVCLVSCLAAVGTASAQEAGPLVDKAFAAIGGRDKILTLFRIEERFNAGEMALPLDKATPRTSVIEPPRFWWVDGKDRQGEPAKFDTWAWTLGVLVDPKTKATVIPGAEEQGQRTLALRISGSVDPAMDLHFDPETHRLIRIDWREDIYRFSQWKEQEGFGYFAKTVMFRRDSGVPWFHHEITKLERLKELPAGLSR